MSERSPFSGWKYPPMRETAETIDATELARRYREVTAERDALAAENARLREAIEALWDAEWKRKDIDAEMMDAADQWGQATPQQWARFGDAVREFDKALLAARALVEAPR